MPETKLGNSRVHAQTMLKPCWNHTTDGAFYRRIGSGLLSFQTAKPGAFPEPCQTSSEERNSDDLIVGTVGREECYRENPDRCRFTRLLGCLSGAAGLEPVHDSLRR
jgi:hypothetical protein